MANPESQPHEASRSDLADTVIDELLPDTDWQRLVRTYPFSALALVFAGGVWLGYRKGSALVAAAAGLAAREVTRRVDTFLGG